MKPQRAKITIELESGEKAEFVAALHIRQLKPFDIIPVREFSNTWGGQKLPDPPQWKIDGVTLGAITLIIPL